MNGTSGFQEVRPFPSRSPTHRFRVGLWHHSHAPLRIIGVLIVLQVWLLWLLGPEIFAQTVFLEGLEVTQSIQVMSLSNPSINNSVPMIANKKTVVRAYFSTSGTVTLVSGKLIATPNPCQVGATCAIDSANSAPVIVSSNENGNLSIKRNNIAKSLIFVLPENLTRPGTLTLTLEQVAGPGDTAITCTDCTERSARITFISSPPLRLRLIGLKYERPIGSGTWYEPRNIDFALIRSWLKRAYPVSAVTQELQDDTSFPYSSSTFGDLFQDDDGDGIVDDDTCMYANAQIQAIRNSELGPIPWFFSSLSRTHYYGLIYDGGTGSPNFITGCSDHPIHPIPADLPGPSTTAAGPVGPAGDVGPPSFSWDTDGSYGDWYAAHELGHTFGRLHLKAKGCATNATKETDLAVDGQVSPNHPSEPHYVGMDTGDTVTPTGGPPITLPIAVVPGSGYDIMTYCNPYKWINYYTYDGIHERLVKENTPLELLEDAEDIIDPSGPLARLRIRLEKYVNILATVNFKQRTGRIHQADQIKQRITKPQTPDERVQIRVTHLNGKMASYPIEVRQNIDTPPDKRNIGLINSPIPITDNIAKIELVMVGGPISDLGITAPKTLDTITVTKKPPSVKVKPLPSFETRAALFKGPLALSWRAYDPDSTTLTYTVQFNGDNARPWQTLGIGLTQPNLEIEPRLFKDFNYVKIKVIASDGFNKGEKIVTLTIPEK